MSKKEIRIRVGMFVTIQLRGKKKTWNADYWWKGKHCRKSLKTRNLPTARQWAVQLDNQLQQGYNPMPQSAQKRVSIQQATDNFLQFQKTEKRRGKTRKKYDGLLKKFIGFADMEGITNLVEVDLSFIDRYRDFRDPQIGERSMANEGQMLKTFFGWCAQRQLMPINPLTFRKFPRPKYEPRGGPTLEQLYAVLSIVPRDLLPIIAIAAFTGRRSGEIQHLLKEDIDLAGNWIHFVSRPGTETKTGNSGKVPIHPRLRMVLEQQPKSKSEWFFNAAPSPQYPEGGHHLNMRDVNEQFQKLLMALKIPAGKKNGGYTFHSLRSFFKTFCVNAGIPCEVVDK
ncbi:MAG TPA: site-specific integrase [Pirellulales bacterium]|jgi:integrase|nr:site-specific integrase [Pirellulales bacterium]